jgi:flagellar basal body P-ring formation protein FlgA
METTLRLFRATLAAALLLAAAAAPAQAVDPALAATVQAMADAQLPNSARVEVTLGELDPRLRLAPCHRIEPFVPPGQRLWGRSRIGLRCTEGAARWTVYLPVTVKVFGTALVARTALPAGANLGAADTAQAEVDLAEDASAALVDAQALNGRQLARPLQSGQVLRTVHLRPRQWFAAGETVQIRAGGSGFAVAATGQALTPGLEGQPVRVRTESGRVLTGEAVGERRVEVSL